MSYFYFMNNAAFSQMLGFILSDGTHTVLVDGGTKDDAENLLATLENRKVDAWFFTHPHPDHTGAFMEIAQKGLLPLPPIYLNFPPLEFVKEHSERGAYEYQALESFYNVCPHFIKIQADDRFCFGNLKIEVLRVFNPAITTDTVNSSSAVFRVSDQKSLLILGDLSKEGGRELMARYPSEVLSCDYIQLSHHGQNGVDFEFYRYIRPQICLWASPKWLYENDLGKGFDTADFQTVRTREWMSRLGVNSHYMEFDGPHRLEL